MVESELLFFFIISVWFLVDKKGLTLLNSLKRIWVLEREILFWSLTLFICSLIFLSMPFSLHTLLSSLFPLVMGTWWYASAYAMFLLFMPFLSQGLRILGRRRHAQLCIVSLGLWGGLGLLPKIMPVVQLGRTQFYGFFYLFILITFYKWYMDEFTLRESLMLVVAGEVVIIVYWFVSNFLEPHFSSETSLALERFMVADWSLPIVMIGFGLFSLFNSFCFSNVIVNWLAASTFGVYLIHQYEPVANLLFVRLFNVVDIWDEPYAFVLSFVVLSVSYFMLILIESLRKPIFILLDRNRGRVFDLIIREMIPLGRLMVSKIEPLLK